MAPSLSIVGHLVTLPFKLLYLTVQYYTVGTIFTNATTKKSLVKTLHNGLNQHMGRSLRVQDCQLAYKPISRLFTLLNSAYDHLPGYNEKYTDHTYDSCESIWLTKNIKSKDSPIVLYFHGGCFAIQMSENQAQGMANLYEGYKLRYGEELSILVADYSLSSMGYLYPTQYNEATNVYESLVADRYTNIILMGDSAGGNLVINLLSYLDKRSKLHDVVWPTAAVAISPYLNVSKQEKKGSFAKYDAVDFFNYDMTKYFGNIYIGGDESLHKSPVVNIELNSDAVDWKNIPTIRDGKLFVQLGDHEVLTDEILRWCEKAEINTRHPENISIDIDGTHIGFFVSESIAFGSIKNWSEQYCADSILKFLHNKLAGEASI